MKQPISYVDVDVNTVGKLKWIVVRVWRSAEVKQYKKQKNLKRAPLLQGLLLKRSLNAKED